MRPVRLVLDGFGPYRRAAEVDFSGVDYFVLTGPTGAGKSTVIDGICFALYGTAPRWSGRDTAGQALAPEVSACRVTLAFDAAQKRYAVVRALARDGSGVHAGETRLDLLDGSVPPDAGLDEIMGAAAGRLAEGPEQVTAAVEEILGLSYEHFIQSVLLPQGRFADFLRAEPGKRQELLAELLALGAFAEVGQLARQRAERAAGRLQAAQRERAQLTGVTEQDEERASNRAADLTSFASVADYRVQDIIRLTDQVRQREQQAEAERAQCSLLAGITVPADIHDLAGEIARAEQAVASRRQQAEDAERAVDEAERARHNLPDLHAIEAFGRSYARRRALSSQLHQQQWHLTAKLNIEKAAASALQTLQDRVEQVRAARDAAAQKNARYALAEELRPGQMCPVCLQRVTEAPHHRVPPGIRETRAVLEAAETNLEAARKAHADAALDVAIARFKVEMVLEQLSDLAVALARAPEESEVTNILARATEAEWRLRGTRDDARARRREAQDAERDRAALTGKEWSAWGDLLRARDATGIPAAYGGADVDRRDLGAAWSALADWARAQHTERAEHLRFLEREAADQRRVLAELTQTLQQMLAEHGIDTPDDMLEIPAAVAAEKARAVNELRVLARERERADSLDEEILASREEAQVAGDLGKLLLGTPFQRWLCSEALDSLLGEASSTLTELSGGRYQLDRDDHDDLVVVDYADSGNRRAVHTLSGGETFQASLALALALSRQVAGLSGGMRDLQSVFLDEGFGTLDEETLETVVTTLERLAADKDRMVGLVTHIPELAERVPVRFVVSRDGGGSSLRKEQL